MHKLDEKNIDDGKDNGKLMTLIAGMETDGSNPEDGGRD